MNDITQVLDAMQNAQVAAVKAGYEVGMKDAMRWIPVSERLPSYNTTVHIFADGWSELPIRAYLINNYDKPTWVNADDISFAQEDVTHWMPLPAPPVEPQSQQTTE
jgi:hypothetical protein